LWLVAPAGEHWNKAADIQELAGLPGDADLFQLRSFR
jgi:hypothetical protein